MSLFDSEAPAPPPVESTDTRAAHTRVAYTFMYSGVVAIGVGLFALIQTPTVHLRCQRTGNALSSCSLEQRILFGSFVLERETVEGLKGARVTQRKAYRSVDVFYTVVLDAAGGEYPVGTTRDWEAAFRVMRGLNEHVKKSTPSSDATFGPAGKDHLIRLSGMVFPLVGVAFIVAGVRRWRAGTSHGE